MRVLLDTDLRDPGLNLALDEAILAELARGEAPPTLRLWRNPRCVIVGRGQRIADEADLAAARELGVSVLQRVSGGGTVYHHPGNLNFSLYLPLVGIWTSVRRSQDRIGGLLGAELRRELGGEVEAREGAVFARGVKVSGSAQLRRRALLHHGTLLVAPDTIPMDALLLALRPGYSPRGVPSRPALTSDLSSIVGRGVTVEDGITLIRSAFRPLGDEGQDAIAVGGPARAKSVASLHRGM